VVVLDGQCPVGPLQPCCRLSACVPGRELRTAQDPARPCTRGGHPGDVVIARSCIRPVPRGAVSLGPGSFLTPLGQNRPPAPIVATTQTSVSSFSVLNMLLSLKSTSSQANVIKYLIPMKSRLRTRLMVPFNAARPYPEDLH